MATSSSRFVFCSHALNLNLRSRTWYIGQIVVRCGYLPHRGNGTLVQILTTYLSTDCQPMCQQSMPSPVSVFRSSSHTALHRSTDI